MRLRAAGLAALARGFVVDLRDLRGAFDILRALRAVRTALRRALDLVELRRDFAVRAGRRALPGAFLLVFRPALRVPAFALRFAITSVLSVPQVFSRDDPRHP